MKFFCGLISFFKKQFSSQILFMSVLFFSLSSASILSCRSPTSPETDEPTYLYTYGLYDDFESGGINPKLWDFMGPEASSYIHVEDDRTGTGNHILEISANILDSLHLTWPAFLYPDEFDRMSAKVKLFPSQIGEEFVACLTYRVNIPEQGGSNWVTEIGVRRNPVDNVHIYAEWKNFNTGRVFYKKLQDAEYEKWYELEIKITMINSSSLKVEYSVDNQVLAESIPEDSAIFLDHDRIGWQRYTRSIKGGTVGVGIGIGWFDDIWAVKGDKPANLDSAQSYFKSPLIFEEIWNPMKHRQINTEKNFLKRRKESIKEK